MTTTLRRITTEYIEIEDRLRISGEIADAEAVVIWLTQRLLLRLLPLLLQWLDQQTQHTVNNANTPRVDVLQSFAQQTARAQLEHQPPVRPSGSSATWLAHSVDIAQSAQEMALTFKSVDDLLQPATLALAAQPLRQWLNIVYDAFVIAGWPLEVWPDWIRDGATPAQAQIAVWH